MNKIFTLGYQSSSPQDVTRYMRALGSMLVDIRYAPYSKDLRWRQPTLRALVGPERYLWLQTLGNVNYKNGGEIKLFNAHEGARRLRPVLERMPIVLLCVCWSYENCHRKVAAEFLAEHLGATVEHLPGHIESHPRLLAAWTQSMGGHEVNHGHC